MGLEEGEAAAVQALAAGQAIEIANIGALRSASASRRRTQFWPKAVMSRSPMVDALGLASERIKRIEGAIEEFVPRWSLEPLVHSFRALRGVDLIVAATFAAEVGDVTRFENPRQLMGYLGLVPSERSTGASVRRGAITKAGNSRVRYMLVESAWTYRHPPRIGVKKLYIHARVSPAVREIAWKAQSRLTARYRKLSATGKRTTVVCTAVARELAGFMWSVGRVALPA